MIDPQTITPDSLRPQIDEIASIPSAPARFFAMAGFAMCLPQSEDDPGYELESAPRSEGVSWKEEDLKPSDLAGLALLKQDCWPRLEFLTLLEEVATLETPEEREEALRTIVAFTLSTDTWVAW